ncbi:hypothetical protein BSKO_06973 [Bryopsis sp. KO-2023]|nr:hypothetical protein BSKO_06973 [Bryopsis sp. KO-2023]
MSGITEAQRQQMRLIIVQYLGRITGQHQQNLQTPAQQIEDDIFRKCKNVTEYQQTVARQLESVKRKLAKQAQQAQQAAHAQAQGPQVPVAAPKQPQPHATLNPTALLPGQQFPQDPLTGAGGMSYFPAAQHPANHVPPPGQAPPPPQQQAFATSATRAPVRFHHRNMRIPPPPSPKPEIRHVSLGLQSSFNQGVLPFGGHQVQHQVQHTHSQAQTNLPFVREPGIYQVAYSTVTTPPQQVVSSYGFPQGRPWVHRFSPSATSQMMGMTSGFAVNPLADPSQFPGVSHQQMHASRNVAMPPAAGGLDHLQQMPNAYQTPPPAMGIGGIRPTMTPSITPVPNLVQHSQPVVQNPMANAMANPMAMYQQPVYNPMGVAPTPAQAKPGFIPSAVTPVQPPQAPQMPQMPQGVPDGGHQLETVPPEMLAEMFMKKSAELNAKYHRELKNAIAFLQKVHEAKRDFQSEKVLDFLRTWLVFITANEHTKFASKITADLYRVLCSLENKIPQYLRQFSSRMRHPRRDTRAPVTQGIPTNPQQLQQQQQQQQHQHLVAPPPQQQQHLVSAGAPLAAPYAPNAWPADQKPGGVPVMRPGESSKTPVGVAQAGAATVIPIDIQMDSNSDGIHKMGSDRLVTTNPAKALVSMLKQMPASKMLEMKQEFQQITAAHPPPPPNPPEGFFAFFSSPSDEMSARPLTVQSQKIGCFEIDASDEEGSGEGEGSDAGNSEETENSDEGGSDSEQHEEHWMDLEEEKARIQAAMGEDVRVKGESPKGVAGLGRGMLVVDWRLKGNESKEDEGEEGSPKSCREFVSDGWKRLRVSVGGEDGPTACFSSVDKSYDSPRNVSARSLFKSKLEQAEGGNLTDLVETWSRCCSEVESFGKKKRKHDEIDGVD